MYRDRFGPFNHSLRMERMMALSASLHFKGLEPSSLMVWPKREEEEASVESVFAMLKSVARKKDK